MLQARRAAYLQVGATAFLVGSILLLSHSLPVADLIERLQKRVAGLGASSALCYPLLFAACNVLLLPGGILSVGAGFFFGLWWGFFLVLIGNSISAAFSFAFSRWVGTWWLGKKFSHNSIAQLLKAAVERDARKIIFLTQLHPLFPTSLINYLYGLTRIRFGIFMLWTALGRAPGLFLYTYMGTLGQLGLNLVRGKSHPRLVEYWTWGGAFVIAAVLFILLTRMASAAVRGSDDSYGAEGKRASNSAPIT